MRMRLYAAEFERPDGTKKGFVVAPSGEAACEFIRKFHSEAEILISRITVTPIDEKLPNEHRRGLIDMLENAPVGFASKNEHFGWLVHSTIKPRLKYYRIESQDGSVAHVIAPNADVASAIWLASVGLDAEGCHPHWSISNDMRQMCEQQKIDLKGRLEIGSARLISWNQDGRWSDVF